MSLDFVNLNQYVTSIGQATINGHIETVITMLLYCTDPLKMIESSAMFRKDVNQNILNLKSRQTKKAANNLWHSWHRIRFLSFKDYF